MTKKILMGLLMVILASCTKKEKMFSDQIILLQKKNDSLSQRLTEFEGKYVFDSIEVIPLPKCTNTFKLGSLYEVDIMIAGYNKKNSLITYDSIVGTKKINADTLIRDQGVYRFSKKLTKEENRIRIDVKIGEEYGKSMEGTLHDLIKTK